MKHVKVGYISFDFEPPIGGQGTYVSALVKHMQKSSMDFAVYSSAESDASYHTKGPRISRKNAGPIFFSLWVSLCIGRWLKRANIDVAHVQTGAGGVLLLRKLSCPVVVTSHMLYSRKRMYSKNPLYTLLFWWERRTFRVADTVIATSDFMKQDIVSQYAIDPQKVKVIYPGVDLSVFSSTQSKKQNKQRSVVFAGRIEPNKRVLALIRAIAQINDGGESYGLTIVGDGSQKQEAINLALELGISDKVQFVSQVSQNELADYYAKADVLVLPSVYESYGLVAVEAIMSGIPAVVPKNSGLAEIIVSSNVGTAFEDIQELEDLLIKVTPLSSPDIERFRKALDPEFSFDKITNLYMDITSNAK